jgi:hypothetical protein
MRLSTDLRKGRKDDDQVALLRAEVESLRAANKALSNRRRAKKTHSVREEVLLYNKSYRARGKMGRRESKKCRRMKVNRGVRRGNSDVAHSVN